MKVRRTKEEFDVSKANKVEASKVLKSLSRKTEYYSKYNRSRTCKAISAQIIICRAETRHDKLNTKRLFEMTGMRTSRRISGIMLEEVMESLATDSALHGLLAGNWRISWSIDLTVRRLGLSIRQYILAQWFSKFLKHRSDISRTLSVFPVVQILSHRFANFF